MLEQYLKVVKNFSMPKDAQELPKHLLIDRDGDLSVFYAPFDYINSDARIVICGITPGLKQATMALFTAKERLLQGDSVSSALVAAKEAASFGGPMRANLIKMLNEVGISQKLGIENCAELFGSQSSLVHYTSALRYPVFKSGKNYSGAPSMVSNRFLRRQIDEMLIPELETINQDVFIVPLGPRVEEVLNLAVSSGVVRSEQTLGGLPHPSGANAERIKYFLGEKPSDQLSSKTNARKIDKDKENICAKVAGF